MTESVSMVGTPSRYTEPLDWSHVRTDVQTHAESYSPTSEISPFVTRTRTYGFEVWS